MSLLDLSQVTLSLLELLRACSRTSTFWPATVPPEDRVVATSLDEVQPGQINVYLYHLVEDAGYKNQPPVGRDPVPVRTGPMGLALYYQITARGAGASETAVQNEQRLLGFAVKTLHDYPVIDDATEVPVPASIGGPPPINVLAAAGLAGRRNRFRIVNLPLPPQEATQFWSAASKVPRAAAYYQVSVVELEPEPPASVAGRVLRYGVRAFVGGAPRLSGSENTLRVMPPGEPAMDLAFRPAEVPVGSAVTFRGWNLAGDAPVTLLLRHRSFDSALEADSAWGVLAFDDRIVATVQTSASGAIVAPGMYSAQVRVTTRTTLPNGTVRDVVQLSNETPFAITPRIDTVAAPVGDVVVVTGHSFDGPGFDAESVDVLFGERRLARVASATALAAGEFRVRDGQHIELKLPADATAGEPRPLRILVRGAESPPRWVTP